MEANLSDHSLISLIRDLRDEMTTLMRQEIALAKAETAEKACPARDVKNPRCHATSHYDAGSLSASPSPSQSTKYSTNLRRSRQSWAHECPTS